MAKMKMVNCKVCGAEIAKTAKVCPHCGAKNKKHTVVGVLLILFGLFLLGSVFSGGGDEPEKVGDLSSGAESQSKVEQVEKTTFGVGEKVELNDVVVTLLDVKESSGKDFFTPTDGNVFVVFQFEIENGTDGDVAVSSMMSFEAYFDDYAANLDVSAMAMSEMPQLDGTVAAGKKFMGVVGYQAPEDWENAEIRFTPNFWSGKDIAFSYSK